MKTRHQFFKNGRAARFFFVNATVLLLIGGLLGACSPPQMQAPAPVIRTVEVAVEKEVVGMPTMAAERAPEQPAIPQATQVAQAEGEGSLLLTSYSGQSPMIIKDGSIDLLVADTDRVIDQVVSLAQQQGGYVISSNSYVEGGFKFASFRLGVPSGMFEQTMAALRRLAIQVINESSSGQDVSSEYADLQTRLTNLEATAARVRSFLDEADTVEDALRVNATLSQLEKEIAQIKGMMKFYEGRSAFSTITVSLSPQRPTPTPTLTPTLTPTPTPTPGWNPGGTFQNASKTSVRLYQGLMDLLIWIVALFWPLLVLVGVGLFFFFRRRKAKKKVAAE
jgi:hypothetical protein